ncbi:MAG: hypothetical protein IJD39_07825 [Clostridia bacterium]|nr:hypothetical protein [Clostridia bacterium]
MKRCVLLACLLLMLTAGCAGAYEYIPDADVSFLEPFGNQPVNTQPGFSYASERALYLFSRDIPKETRDQFIGRQEALMDQLNVSGLTFCILPGYDPWVISETKQIFLSPDDESGMIQAIATLQALRGEYTHYGLLFGYADQICKNAGLSGHELRFNDKGMVRFYNDESHLSAFMLLYPCFSDLLDGNETNIPFVQDMAVRFCAFLSEKDQLQSMLQEENADAFNQRYIALMNEFLQSAGAETQLYTHLPALRFGAAGSSYPLVISTAHGEWYIHKDYSDPEDYWLVHSFDSLFNTVWKTEDDLAKVDQALGISPSGSPFLFAGNKGAPARSLYTHYDGNGPIAPSGIDDLIHEYVHACTLGWYEGDQAWFLTELAATYFEIQGQKNPQDELVYTLWYDLSDAQAEYWGPVLDAMDQGEVLSYFPDPPEVYHYLCYSHGQYDLFTPGSRTLNAIRSFAYYLEQHYGNEKMGLILREGTPEHVLQKDWSALQQDWIAHLAATFGKAENQDI